MAAASGIGGAFAAGSLAGATVAEQFAQWMIKFAIGVGQKIIQHGITSWIDGDIQTTPKEFGQNVIMTGVDTAIRAGTFGFREAAVKSVWNDMIGKDILDKGQSTWYMSNGRYTQEGLAGEALMRAVRGGTEKVMTDAVRKFAEQMVVKEVPFEETKK